AGVETSETELASLKGRIRLARHVPGVDGGDGGRGRDLEVGVEPRASGGERLDAGRPGDARARRAPEHAVPGGEEGLGIVEEPGRLTDEDRAARAVSNVGEGVGPVAAEGAVGLGIAVTVVAPDRIPGPAVGGIRALDVGRPLVDGDGAGDLLRPPG